MNRFAEEVVHPDPVKRQQFVTDADFYREGDAIIQLAESIKRGAVPSQAEIDAALEADCVSDYAKALRKGYASLVSASAFFTGAMDQEKLNEQLAV